MMLISDNLLLDIIKCLYLIDFFKGKIFLDKEMSLFFQDKIDIDFQSEYLRDDDDDDVFNSEEDENENAMFQQLNRDIDILFIRDVTCGVDSGDFLF